MIIKNNISAKALLIEASYNAKLTSIKGFPDENNPKKVLFGFKIEGHEDELIKEVPYSFKEGTPLRKDTETLLGKALTAKEASDGFNLDTLLQKQCLVVVMHKAGAGGKPKAVVSVIMAVPAPQQPTTIQQPTVQPVIPQAAQQAQ